MAEPRDRGCNDEAELAMEAAMGSLATDVVTKSLAVAEPHDRGGHGEAKLI